MAKIVSMSSGAIDPINVTKRVFWRPDTNTKVLKVGQPVCYDSDDTHDHKERTADPTHLGLTQHTYAEGAQDRTGRLFVVEEPQADNLHAFAGICKCLGPKAGADGDMIEIFVPIEGAVVPVWADQNCVLDRTILGIYTAVDDVTKPGTAIGVAKETYNRGTAGLVWMQFKNFITDNTNATLQVDDSNTNPARVNQINVEFLQTAGQCSALFVEAAAGSGGNPDCYDYGLAGYFQSTWKSGSTIGSATTLGVWMNIDDGALTVDGGHISVIQAGIYENSDAWAQDQSNVSVLQLNLQIANDPGANCLNYIRMRNDGAHAIDGIFSFPDKASCGMADSAVTPDRSIPFLVGGALYYFSVATTTT